jgi:hypothetical protein
MPLRRGKIASLFGERKKYNKMGETWWLREETTYVTCSNIDRNLFKSE